MKEIKYDKEMLLKRLSDLFGSYRAEWSRKDIFRHFSEPSYFSDLVNFRPCVLQGGRGSGKTTALKGLSYQGQYALHDQSVQRFDNEVSYIGLYLRVDTNHVRAFKGGAIDECLWGKLFGHYFNLLFAKEIIDFLMWHSEKGSNDEQMSSDDMRQILKSMCMDATCNSYGEFRAAMVDALCDFQNVINNIGSYDCSKGRLSLIGEPIDFMLSKVKGLRPFGKKIFYLLLDEYENFEDYQQIIVNTMIKHAAENFTFKIGVKEAGWRKKHTLNQDEILYDPADYALVDINKKLGEGDEFFKFAKSVCEKRFEMLLSGQCAFNVETALEDLTVEELALRLGVESRDLTKSFDCVSASLKKQLGELSPLYKFSIAYWAASHGTSLTDEIHKVIENRAAWDTRYDNYKYHFLFKIRTGRGSGRSWHRQMLYCGFETFVKLASNNIRFLMELVYKTFEKHLIGGGDICDVVSAETQTEVTWQIGEKNLAQLECVEADGPRIVNLLCGLGRVFEKLAKDKEPGTPEVNQFSIEGDRDNGDVEDLLSVAVRNLALVRFSGNKLDGFKTKSYDYCLHPIFAPFFTFSYRRKRKMPISMENLEGLSKDPDKYVAVVLNEYKKYGVAVCPASAQLDFGI